MTEYERRGAPNFGLRGWGGLPLFCSRGVTASAVSWASSAAAVALWACAAWCAGGPGVCAGVGVDAA